MATCLHSAVADVSYKKDFVIDKLGFQRFSFPY